MTAKPPAKRIVHEEDQDRLRSLWFNIYVPKWAPKVTWRHNRHITPASIQAYVPVSHPRPGSSRPTRSTAPYPLRAHLSLPYMPILRHAGATPRVHSCGSWYTARSKDHEVGYCERPENRTQGYPTTNVVHERSWSYVTAKPPAKRIVHEEDQDRLRSLWFNIYVPKWAPKVTWRHNRHRC